MTRHVHKSLHVPEDLRVVVEAKEYEADTKYHVVKTLIRCPRCGTLLGKEYYYLRDGSCESFINDCEHYEWVEPPELENTLVLVRRKTAWDKFVEYALWAKERAEEFKREVLEDA